MADKSREGTTNRGNQAEVILSAALIAKFIDRPARNNKTPWVVTDKETKDVLSKMVKNARIIKGQGSKKVDKMSGTVRLTRAEVVKSSTRAKKSFISDGISYREVPTIVDIIRYEASIPFPDFEYLTKKTNWPSVQDLFDSSVSYVNSHTAINRLAKRIAVNTRVDDFLVQAAGTEDQTGTKVDIKMMLNGRRTRTQISLKVKGGDQFAQVSGPGFDKQLILWKDALGLNIANIEAEYDRMMRQFNYGISYDSRLDKRVETQKAIVKKATKAVFIEAADLMNAKFRQKNKTYYKKIIEFIKEGAAGQESEFIEVVKLERGKFKRIIFNDQFDDAIDALKLVASVRPHGDPLLYIDDEISGDPLIQIRMKVATESSAARGKKTYRVYPRTIIEAPTKSIMYNLMS